jgi:hypothetical protein
MHGSIFRLIVIGLFMLGGCANMTSVELKNIEQEKITQTLTQAQVEKAILKAGLAKNWEMKVTEPGLIRGHVTVRNHEATIDIRYNERDYSIRYVSSVELDDDGKGKIHRNYNKWIALLDNTIQQELLDAGHP